MSKVKKFVLLPLGLAVLLVLAAGVLGYLYLNTFIENQVETQGTKATGLATTLGSVNLSPLSGSLVLNTFGLANPDGFMDKDKLFAFGEAAVKVKLMSLFSDEVIVPSFHVDGATVNVLFQDGKINVQSLIESIQKQGQSGDVTTPDDPGTPAPPEEPAPQGESQAVIINDLRITNTKVVGQLELFPGQPPLKVDLVLADIVKTDVRGAEMADIIAFVVETVMINTQRELAHVSPDIDAFVGGAQTTGNQVIDDVTNKIDEALPGTGLGGMLNEKGKEELDRAIGDLFKKKEKPAETKPAESKPAEDAPPAQ